jgi:hypothetical protein
MIFTYLREPLLNMMVVISPKTQSSYAIPLSRVVDLKNLKLFTRKDHIHYMLNSSHLSRARGIPDPRVFLEKISLI